MNMQTDSEFLFFFFFFVFFLFSFFGEISQLLDFFAIYC